MRDGRVKVRRAAARLLAAVLAVGGPEAAVGVPVAAGQYQGGGALAPRTAADLQGLLLRDAEALQDLLATSSSLSEGEGPAAQLAVQQQQPQPYGGWAQGGQPLPRQRLYPGAYAAPPMGYEAQPAAAWAPQGQGQQALMQRQAWAQPQGFSAMQMNAAAAAQQPPPQLPRAPEEDIARPARPRRPAPSAELLQEGTAAAAAKPQSALLVDGSEINLVLAMPRDVALCVVAVAAAIIFVTACHYRLVCERRSDGAKLEWGPFRPPAGAPGGYPVAGPAEGAQHWAPAGHGPAYYGGSRLQAPEAAHGPNGLVEAWVKVQRTQEEERRRLAAMGRVPQRVKDDSEEGFRAR